jgi:hypothetical protein
MTLILRPSQSASLSWNKAPIWGLRPDFHYCQTIAGLLILTHLSWVELYYDRRSVGQSVLVSSPHLGLMTRFLLLSDHCGFLIWGAFSDERTGLSFTMYSVQYTIHFTVSDLRLPQLGGPGPYIYIPQEQGGPVIPPGTVTNSSALNGRLI